MNTNTPKRTIRTGVKALIVDKGEVLLIREKVKEGIIYDFPGGGVEYGEKLEEALHREVFEEVGLKIEIGKVVGAWDFMLDWCQVQIVCIGYQCKCLNRKEIDLTKNPAVGENIFEYLWVSKEKILAEKDKFLRVADMTKAVENLEIS